MKNRMQRQRPFEVCFTEGLETRNLLSVGAAGLTNIVENLGTVTRDAAAAGIEVTAQIPAHSSVTFEFDVQTPANYTLLVRHVGNGLTLTATGPTGSGSVDPGPAGPFESLPLSLGANHYSITAAANGDEAVFVDWELLLNNGVGQSAATAPAALLGLNTTSTSTPTATPAPSSPVSSGATFTGSGPAGLTSAAVVASVGSDRADNTPIHLVGEPVGRSSPGSPSALPALAATPARPSAGVQSFLAELDAALVTGIQPPVGGQNGMTVESVTDPEVPIERSWFSDHLGTTPTSVAAELAPAAAELAQFLTHYQNLSEGDQPVSLASISPGLLIGAVTVTVAARGRLKKIAQALGRTIPIQAGQATPKVGNRRP